MKWLLFCSLFFVSCACHKLHGQAYRLLRTDRDSFIVNNLAWEKQEGYVLEWHITNKTKHMVLAPGLIDLYHDSPITPMYVKLIPLMPKQTRTVKIILYPHRPEYGGTFVRDGYILVYGTGRDSAKGPEKYSLYIKCIVTPKKQEEVPGLERK